MIGGTSVAVIGDLGRLHYYFIVAIWRWNGNTTIFNDEKCG